MHSRSLRRALLALVIGGAFAGSARAQDGSWSVDASGDWTDTANWAGGIAASGTGFTATFGNDITADRTVTLTAPQTIGNLFFGDADTATAGSWILSNGGNAANILTLDTAVPTITVNNLGTGKSATISAVIAGSAGLVKDGAGLLVLAEDNTYTGGTTINAGILEFSNVNQLEGATSIATNATLRYIAPNGTSTVANVFTGTGLIQVELTGATAGGATFSGLSGFTGTLRGTAASANANKLILGTATTTDVILDSGTQLYVSTATSIKSLTMSGTGNTELRGAIRLASTLTTTNGVTLTGDSTIGTEGGTLTGSITGTATTGNTQTLTFGTVNSTGAATISGGLFNGTNGGILAVVKTQAGTVTLSAAGNYSGGTIINAGSLIAGNATAFGTDAITINNGATVGSNANVTIANSINYTAGATINTASSPATAGTVFSGAITGTGGLTIASNGNISDSGGSQGGYTILTNAGNSFTGLVTITSGVVDMTSNFGNAANTLLLNGGGIVDRNNNLTWTRAIQIGASGGYLRSYGSSTTTFTNALSNVPGLGFALVRLTDTGVRRLNGDGSGYIGAITNATAGQLQFTSANTNYGRTDFIDTLSVVTLNGGGTANLKSLNKGNFDLIINNGTLLNLTVGNLNWGTVAGSWVKTTAGTAGTLTSSSGALTIANGTFTGNLTTGDQMQQLVVRDYDATTPLTFTKNNQNSLVMSAANTYTGGTVVNGGALLFSAALPATGAVKINAAGALGSTTAAATLLSTGKIDTTSTGSLLISQNVTGALNLASYPTLSLSASPTVPNFTVSGTTITGLITPGANGFLFGTPGVTSTLTTVGALTGSGVNLTKRGSDTLVIAGSNSYTGTTSIKGGTLTLDFANAASPQDDILSNASSLTLGGGTLQVTGKASTVNTQTVAGTALTAGTVSTVTVTSGTSGTANLVLGAITGTRATVNVTLPTLGAITTTGGPTSLLVNSSGGAFATVGGTNFAALDASSNIIAATVADFTGTTTLTGNANLTGAITLGGASSPTSIRTVTAGTNIALAGFALQTAGILSNTAITISGTGGLTALTPGGELVFNQTTGTSIISSGLVNNGTATSFTKTGAGTLTINTTASTMTGTITIAQGVMNNGITNAFGNANIIVGVGATLRQSNSTSLGGTGTVTLMDGAMFRQEAANAVGTMSRNIILNSTGSRAFIGGFLNGNSSLTTSVISGTGDVLLGNWDTANGGIFRTGWRTNSYVGQTYVTANGGNTVQFDFAGATPANNVAVTPFGASTNPAAIIYNGVVSFTNIASTGNNYFINNAIALDATGNYAAGNVQMVFSDAVAHLQQGLTVRQAGTNTATLSLTWSNKPLHIDGALNGYGTLRLTTTNNNAATFQLNAAGNFDGVLSVEGTATVSPYLSLNHNSAAQKAIVSLGGGASRLLINTSNASIVGLTGVAGSDVAATGSNRTLTINGSENFTYLGTIGTNGNSLSLVKSGTGTQTFSGANTYTGTTTINGGTLIVTSALANNGAASILMAAPDDSIAGNPILTRAIATGLNAYAGFGSSVTAASLDPVLNTGLQTQASILMSGNNASANNMSMQWRTRTTAEAAGSNPNAVLSDVLNLSDMGSDLFVLQMSYTDAALANLSLNETAIATSGELRLGWNDAGTWKSAFEGNSVPTGTFAGAISWSTFVTNNSVAPDGSNLSNFLGAYGVDPTTNTVWAVLDHNSEFAVIPEPSTLVLGGLAMLGFGAYRLRRRRAV